MTGKGAFGLFTSSSRKTHKHNSLLIIFPNGLKYKNAFEQKTGQKNPEKERRIYAQEIYRWP
ncbi:MAG: hypothetical protein QME78_04235, partial [Thermodesulfobacteriota bacterium]|nr:hypothetical protein [Thermodesulfobacteriota bacterium]